MINLDKAVLSKSEGKRSRVKRRRSITNHRKQQHIRLN